MQIHDHESTTSVAKEMLEIQDWSAEDAIELFNGGEGYFTDTEVMQIERTIRYLAQLHEGEI